ncbi:MAG TPA: ornithine cyclodeaminase family protein [Candidatus Dormibacteraeota bacterium]|jgi:ornithine cyclodeaminase/alanine dehydrogenase-like protein (mu-crystallin family)
MALLLREADVRGLVDIRDALDALDFAFAEWAGGRAQNQPRRRVTGGSTTLATMSAALPARNLIGYKAYTAGKSGASFWVHLFDASDGHLLAIIEADWLGALRTGAVSGLATRALARPKASILAIVGAGHQALTQALAVAAVRPLTEIRLLNRNPEHRARFKTELSGQLPQLRVIEAESTRDGLHGADVITTITSTGTPLFPGSWIESGQHLNAAGSNYPTRRELDARAVGRADLVVVDDVEAARLEAGDLLMAEQEGTLGWGGVHSLREVIAGTVARSQPDDVTLFKSVGLALEDVALGSVVLDRARDRGVGENVAL